MEKVLVKSERLLMKVLDVLESTCERYCFLSTEGLLFKYQNFCIVVNCEVPDNVRDEHYEFFEDFDYSMTIEELPSIFWDNVEVAEVILSDDEYLGHREDIGKYCEPKSIALKLFTTLSLIYQTYPKIILSYDVNINYGYGGSGLMCNCEPNYIFQIFLNPNAEQLLPFLNELNTLRIPKHQPDLFYWYFLHKYKPLERAKEVSVLHTNSKARRLGYILLLSVFFSQIPKIPSSRINKKFQDFAVQYKSDLLCHQNTKGVITAVTQTGISAKPYIDVAKGLGWISKVNILQVPGKVMKVYSVLKIQTKEEKDNVFALNKLDNLFLLELLIKKDFYYLSVLLEILYTIPAASCNYAFLKENFQKYLLQRIQDYIPDYEDLIFEPKERLQLKALKEIRSRIQSWQKPEVYLRHVLMPRLNWLLDLGLVDFEEKGKKTHYILTDAGRKLFQHFCFWTDVDYSFITNAEEHCKVFYIHTFNNVYFNGVSQNEQSKEEINLKINEYLNESFEYFKTLAPNRVLASQAILFTKYKLYLNDNIKVGQRYIENYLEKTAVNTFIYKYQQQYGDGYIQKIRK